MGARPFSSRKLMEEWNEIMKLMEWKNSWWQNYLLDLCMLTFHTFNWELSLWDFFCSSIHWNLKKSLYYCLIITLWKCEYYLIWALNTSILFDSNSESVSMCDMNSEKTFYDSLIWKELPENVSIAWCEL